MRYLRVLIAALASVRVLYAEAPPPPPGANDIVITHVVGVPDKVGSFQRILKTTMFVHIVTTPDGTHFLIPPGDLQPGSFWMKTAWMKIDDSRARNWWRAGNVPGHRVHALVLGHFGEIAVGGGGGGGAGGGAAEAAIWTTMSVDLDLDADSNRNGRKNLDDENEDIAEDPGEDVPENIGALVCLNGRAPLLLRQVLPVRPKPRPQGIVTLTQQGEGKVKVFDGASEVTPTTDLWGKVKDAELPLEMEGVKAGPVVLTATYDAGGEVKFVDVVKVLVFEVVPIVRGHLKDNPPKPQDPSPPFIEGQDRFVFDREGDHHVRIFFRGNPTPDNNELRKFLDPRCRWAIEDIPGIGRKKNIPEPDWGDKIHAKGLRIDPALYVDFDVRQLPPANEGFGKRKLVLDVIGTPGGSEPKLCPSHEARVRLFFARFKTTHPEKPGDTANWYYYWSQEGGPHPDGGPPVCSFSRDRKNKVDFVDWGVDGTVFGETDKNGNITIFDLAAKQETFDYKFPEKGGKVPDEWPEFTIKTDNAPDFVNLTHGHEGTHRIVAKRRKPPKGRDPDKFPFEPNSDFDGDLITNGEEKALGMDPKDRNSFGPQFTISPAGATRDEEFYAVFGGALSPFGALTKPARPPAYNGRIPVDANEKNDWSKGGFQWQQD